mgnify:CR=1 FL=1
MTIELPELDKFVKISFCKIIRLVIRISGNGRYFARKYADQITDQRHIHHSDRCHHPEIS